MHCTEELCKQLKDAEEAVTKYEAVLDRYGSGRWLDMGRRHLAELKRQRDALFEAILSFDP